MSRAKGKRNSSYKRYRWREKHKKQYTFTKTKFAVGFFLSVLTSVFLGSYFDRYGHILVRQVWGAFTEALADSPPTPTEQLAVEQPQSKPVKEIKAIAERVKRLEVPPVSQREDDLSPG